MPGGAVGAIIAGFIGTWLGPQLIGTWGPSLWGISIFPAVIGAFVVIIVVGVIHKELK